MKLDILNRDTQQKELILPKKIKKNSLLYTIGGAAVGTALGFGLAKLICPPHNKKCRKKVILDSGYLGLGGALLIQKFGFMANSREDELEADRISFKTAISSGYHPDHVGSFYEKLLEMEKKFKQKKLDPISKKFADALSTHPPSKERIAEINKMKNNIVNKKGKINSKSFFQMKKKV